MGTRATIKFKDEYGCEFFVYRGHDGHPANVLEDIIKVLEISKNRWSGSEIGQLISLFFVVTGNKDERIQDYELTNCFHGDESYRYYIEYIDGKWCESSKDNT